MKPLKDSVSTAVSTVGTLNSFATLASSVKTSKPSAQIPSEINTSPQLGEYSNPSPSGVGTNPGTTSPIPFSIQTPTMASTQARLNKARRFLSEWMVRITAATPSRAMALQIQGTSLFAPFRPRYR